MKTYAPNMGRFILLGFCGQAGQLGQGSGAIYGHGPQPGPPVIFAANSGITAKKAPVA